MAQSKRLLILSLDGACWNGLDAFRSQKILPTIDGLIQRGASGPLQAVLPTFTYPNWASFWTGQSPGEHGIYAFLDLLADGNVRQMVGWDSLQPTNWLQYLSDQGKKVVSLYAPLTAASKLINGVVVADQHIIQTQQFISPPEVYSELKAHFQNIHIPQAEQYFPQGGFPNFAILHRFVDQQIESIQKTGEIAQYLLSRYDWDVGLVHFFATDPFQHALWHYMDPRHPDFNKEGQKEVGRFFAALDKTIGQLLEKNSPDAVMVFSVHGFTSTRKILNLNRLLWDQGIFQKFPLPQRLLHRLCWECQRFLPIRFFPKKVKEFMHRSARCPANVFLDLKAIHIHQRRPEDAQITQRIIEVLEELKDPETGNAVIKKAWRIEELYSLKKQRDWDTIVLEFTDGYTGRNGDINLPLLWTCTANKDYLIGTHTQEGIWLMAGEGVDSQKNIPVNVMDLSAMILQYLGLSVPAGMKGNGPSVILDEQIARKVSSS